MYTKQFNVIQLFPQSSDKQRFLIRVNYDMLYGVKRRPRWVFTRMPEKDVYRNNIA